MRESIAMMREKGVLLRPRRVKRICDGGGAGQR